MEKQPHGDDRFEELITLLSISHHLGTQFLPHQKAGGATWDVKASKNDRHLHIIVLIN